jgi:anti-sigma factor RsiW
MTTGLVCVDGVALLPEYLEDLLPAERRAELDGHLQVCPRCVAFVKSYLATARIVRSATSAPMPDAARDSLRRFLAARRRT